MSETNFSVHLTEPHVTSKCSAIDCTEKGVAVVVLCYCGCDAHPSTEAHPFSTDVSASRWHVPVCGKHGITMRDEWACFEQIIRLTDYLEEKRHDRQ